MQVSCSSCGAKYEFDASAIPAAGYDAQCTTCNAVFFVSPEGQELAASSALTSEPAPDPTSGPASEPTAGPAAEQVAISCSHCGAVYQFAASEIPAAGYDAQCTQCQGVFFVSVAAASKVDAQGYAAPPTDVEAAPSQSSQTPIQPQGLQPTPSAFLATDDIPEAAAEDYASMSQVISRERLQAASNGAPTSETADLQTAAPINPSNIAVQAEASTPIFAPVPIPEVPAATLGSVGAVAVQGIASASASQPEGASAAAPAPSAPHSLSEAPPAPLPSWEVPVFEKSTVSTATPPVHAATGGDEEHNASDTAAPTQPGPTAADAAAEGSRVVAESASTGGAVGIAETPQASVASPAPKKRTLWLGVAVSVAAVVAVGVGVGLRLAPRKPAAESAKSQQAVEDLPVVATAAPVHSAAARKAVSPKATAAFERGMRTLFNDTTAGYTAAQEAFQEALKVEPDMVDAHAGMALQALLVGGDLLAQGQLEWSEAKKREATAAAYQARVMGLTARGKRGRDLDRGRMTEAFSQAAQWRERAMLHLHTGENSRQNGVTYLWRGSQLMPQTPLLQATAALWLASDPHIAVPGENNPTQVAALAQLAEAAQWLVAPGDGATTGPSRPGANPHDPWAYTWLLLAKARILAAKPTTVTQAQAALEAAIAHEPYFTRGRWELAASYAQNGQKALAQKAAEGLLALLPAHEKALALVDSLKAVPGQGALTPGPAAPAGKLSRTRGHRGKRAN